MSSTTANWYLKKKNDAIYGPVSIEELALWAQQCRILAGNQASPDQHNWIPVEDIPELAMEWLARRSDGKQYGPFPLSALPALIKHHVLPADAVLTHRVTTATIDMQEALDRLSENGNEQTTNPTAPTAAPQETEGDQQSAVVPETQVLQETLNKMRTELAAVTKKAASQREQVQEKQLALQAQIDALQDAREQARAEIEALQDAREQAHAKIDALQDALEQARVKTEQILAHDDQHATVISELRQQVAFMKKNIAALNAQLVTARNTAAQRARMLAIALVVVTIITAALIVTLLGRGRQPAQTLTAEPPEPRTTAPAASESLPPITQRHREQTGTPPPVAATEPRPATMPDIQVAGISVISRNEYTRTLRFDEGIFSSLDALSPEGRQRLDALARQLPRNLAGWHMTIQGHTDNIPLRSSARFADNRALALARAEAVVQYLTQRAGFPPETMQAQAGSTAPFPNDTNENRIRNRTVTIEIKPRTTPNP